MRPTPSILHLDLDAFFASVEQRDKPSLRGKPVVVGGVGARGVVATASYEARVFGVHSAMSAAEARQRAPHAAFLGGRFDVYRESSRIVMGLLHELSDDVEPLSLDEAYVDLASGGHDVESSDYLRELGELVRAEVRRRTGGLTASVGMGSSKFIAKIASEQAKPDGLVLVAPGSEVATIAPLPVRAIPGVGPVTMEKLNRLGVRTVADVQRLSVRELIREVGASWGESLHELAFARDDRRVEPTRETKSISVEQTFDVDVRDRAVLQGIVERDAAVVAGRVEKARLFARTVTLKVRMADFTTLTRSRTLSGATDRPETIAAVAGSLLDGVDLREGVRLLGVGVANFTEAAQEELFAWAAGGDVMEERSFRLGPTGLAHGAEPGPAGLAQGTKPGPGGGDESDESRSPSERSEPRSPFHRPDFPPGADIWHDEFGPGWVWGSGLGRVTVRFETAATGIGPVRTLAASDPMLHLGRRPVD